MELHTGELSDVNRYLANRRGEKLADKEPAFKRILRYIGKFKPIHPGLRMIEIGTGTGFFPILSKLSGLNCEGIEISSQLIDHARSWGRELGAEPDIRLGNIETADLGESVYDVIVASSVFEHIEFWRPALAKMYRALRPGGALFFESTNKWSIKSGEFPMPFYGWLPNWGRYELRKVIHGAEIMKLGIDFHQFTYIGLRRTFRQIGFSEAHDVFELTETSNKGRLKARLIELSRQNRLLRQLMLLFFEGTTFVCIK